MLRKRANVTSFPKRKQGKKAMKDKKNKKTMALFPDTIGNTKAKR